MSDTFFGFFAKNFGFLILNACSFALMQKNQKIKTENSTKLLNHFLKFPNSHGKTIASSFQNLSRASNSGNFLTEMIQKFLTSPFSKSIIVKQTLYFHSKSRRVTFFQKKQVVSYLNFKCCCCCAPDLNGALFWWLSLSKLPKKAGVKAK
ncbi:hypothetical protein SAMN05216273_106171 [Chryseobacterium taihuense]|uniref:Uncharacterized protein n=1 Tax=Chryseobacterium taihuense TaxID=1141221 RepID=A0ABY0QTB2_9FLAO|nr:hypothetical protein SAMN05216273_106171 [Chryseobacterium taihuense]